MTRRLYLVLTVILLTASIGTGFAMHQRNRPLTSALQSLENARAQLQQAPPDPAGRNAWAITLVNQAIREIKNELSSAEAALASKD